MGEVKGVSDGEAIEVVVEDKIATVFFNRPKVFNSFDLEMINDFAEKISSLSVDSEVRGVVISGKGKAFCAGGDVRWAANHPHGASAALHLLAGSLHTAIVEIRRMRKPVIAAINGVAAGAGFSLALACDFRVMEKSAMLRQAYTSNGLCIDGGGTYTLPRLVGLAKAMEIAAFDEPISAEKALEWGLVTKVVDDGKSVEEALNLARTLAEKSLYSFGWVKSLLTESFSTPLEVQLERERKGLSTCAAHPDGKEGIQAFLEKRKPVFNR
jgi:2-(1,2-epoxy-1,2-dihydrophenyl)acetyl-CoA isomerase